MGMNGMELDQEMRRILLGVTRDNVLSSVQAFVNLGFGGSHAFLMCIDVINAKERGEFPPKVDSK